GWVLIGDAFGFVDPVYSSGVMLAMKSGEMAADTIHGALEAGDVSTERLGTFGPRLAAGMHLLRQLVFAFYDRDFSFGKFLGAHPEYRDHLVRVLIGDVFNDDVGKIFTVMRNWTDLPDPVPLIGNGRTK
ncbi:MAG: NAD(P)/FAD-dependent oxidoreductase, partial [Phycisphaerae bacterium]